VEKNELALELKKMYDNAPKDEKVTMIHLFGINFKNEIQNSNTSPKELAEMAGVGESYGTEINKGMKLAKYCKDAESNNKMQLGISKKPNNSDKKSYPKNIILYGPPGTGKTYSHKKLIAIIENGGDLSELANQEYDISSFQTVKSENRYEFVTFHQSFSYEDFVEGYRPQENGGLIIEDGILKEISKRAKNNLEAYTNSEIKKDFETIFKELILDKLENEERVAIKMKKSNFYIKDVSDKSIMFDKESGDSEHHLSISTLKKMYETGQNDIVIGGLQHYYTPLLNFLLESSKEIKKEPLKNFYLIIDEINRGNISKILGELITLIEDDKRIGEDNELTLKLPYSRERFGIPKNLYIIGTMNTADKSIALIDVALRRRFSFMEMNPLDEFLPQNIIEINKIIESKLSKDYKIGHGYFMGNSDLKSVIEYKIKPLIEEYFYNDSATKDKIFKLLDDGGVENA